MLKKYFSFSFILLLLMAAASCSRKGLPVEKQTFSSANGKYDAAPPAAGVSSALSQIAQSVYKLNVIAFYKSYAFYPEEKMTLPAFRKKIATEKIYASSIASKSVLGTASVIGSNEQQTLFLTCAHVVHFPDTVINYFPDHPGVISSISIKVKQKNYVAGLEYPEAVLLAADTVNDIALLKARHTPNEKMQAIPFKPGNTNELNWGTFVYVMGFPKGQKMVESGIVSKPEKPNSPFFLINAVFNRGISGGPVFALRDGSNGFEWVGMVKSSPATDIFYLEPAINNKNQYNPAAPYHGILHINKKKMINYGITFSVSIEEIVKFVEEKKADLKKQGVDIQTVFDQIP
ncbi:serine protease [Candidatus Sulfidibacterium hydrothermale]|uniref:S1 family peptidase n=1 Tax=Candidatus Sulfidibacterium hydrothermale TaxID=2875962 RepID=UPI001F0B6BFF|nr:serine protease [Candidatus Sulfidibacterium hydrothermale]UBM62888.1 serine protease [Candidatus Sulfidibacterium hydrothermale]